MSTVANPGVLASVCSAFGHLKDRRAVPIVLKLIDHPNRHVRFDVVMALIGCFAGGSDSPQEEAAIAGLIKLSTDEDVQVRDWATSGLGKQVTADTVAIRTALYARLTDGDGQVMIEAIEGLARRKDKTVLPALVRALREQGGMPPLDAAHELASSPLCTALLEARKLLEAEPQTLLWHHQWLEAMTACGCPLDIDELINLSSDDDYQVRDWATFGLGQVVAEDTAQIRVALHARLDDSWEFVKDEAIRGLARRKDGTVLPILVRELRTRVTSHLLEAARDLAAPSLCAALSEARKFTSEAQKAGRNSYNYYRVEGWEKLWLEATAACGCRLDDA
jgi:HEAT repeat protein